MTDHDEQPDDDEVQVVDVTAERRFTVTIGEHVAELTYRVSDGVLVLVHTGVPDELEGRGIGGQLVRAAVDRAARDGLAIAPWCPFARKWLEEHPDEAARVTVDFDSRPSRR